MKFKILVIALNIVLAVFFLSIFILPFLLDSIDLKVFFARYWFFPVVFVVLGIAINMMYSRNKDIITGVEDGDWVGLCHTLETEIFDKNHLTFKNAKLLADVQLLLSDFTGLKRLETAVRNKKSNFLPKLATRFAGGKLLSGQYDELYNFANNLVKSGKTDDALLLFYVPFSLQMLKEHKRSSDEFSALLNSCCDDLVSVMASYLYYDVLKKHTSEDKTSLKDKAQSFCKRIKDKYSKEAWNTYTTKQKTEMQFLVLKKIIDDASAWLYS